MQPARFNPKDLEATDAQRMLLRFQERFSELRRSIQDAGPEAVAERTGAKYTAASETAGRFQLSLWGKMVQLTYPEYEVFGHAGSASGAIPVTPLDTAFLLYYFATADGAPLEDRWIAFSDLADGRFYTQAFEGYTGTLLARSFGDDLAAFERAATAVGGRRIPLGDAAFAFQALPRVLLAAVFWRGDEDFPSTCRLLFDACANHYLPTDACAILGSALTRMLIKAKG